MSRTYVLSVREAPRSNNRRYATRGHAHAEKKRWQALFLSELMVAKAAKGMRFCSAEIAVRWKRRNHQDIENFRDNVIKPLADALVAGGYLNDDTSDWFHVADMRAEYPPEWPYADPRLKCEVVVKLEASYS